MFGGHNPSFCLGVGVGVGGMLILASQASLGFPVILFQGAL